MGKEKSHLSIVVIGDVNAGKSTTSGNLIYKLGGIDARTITKFEKEATEMGKASPQYVWVLHKLRAERERATTIDVSLCQFETPNNQFTIIDAPGYREFTKNMVNGASQADVALLVVSMQAGECEAGTGLNGQICEQLSLVSIIGVKQIVVAINKMDLNWNQDRYNEIVKSVSSLVKKIGYNPEDIPFVPISAFEGENMYERSSRSPWHKGPTLIEALDALHTPDHGSNKPLRISIKEVREIGGAGTVIVGRVEAGILKPGTAITFAPVGVSDEVKSVEVNNVAVSEAHQGDIVGFNVRSLSAKDICGGMVAGDSKNNPPAEVGDFTALVVVSSPSEIQSGYTAVLECHTARVDCKFVEILAKVDKRYGVEFETAPKSIKNGEVAVVKFQPSKPLCVETFAEYPALGRFTIRDRRQNVAAGVIRSVSKKSATAESKK